MDLATALKVALMRELQATKVRTLTQGTAHREIQDRVVRSLVTGR